MTKLTSGLGSHRDMKHSFTNAALKRKVLIGRLKEPSVCSLRM